MAGQQPDLQQPSSGQRAQRLPGLGPDFGPGAQLPLSTAEVESSTRLSSEVVREVENAFGHVQPELQSTLGAHWKDIDSAVTAVAPQKRNAGELRRLTDVLLVVCLAIVFAGLATSSFFVLDDLSTDVLSEQFDGRATDLHRNVETQVNKQLFDMSSLSAFWSVTEDKELAAFVAYGDSIAEQQQGLGTIAWCPYVPEGQETAWGDYAARFHNRSSTVPIIPGVLSASSGGGYFNDTFPTLYHSTPPLFPSLGSTGLLGFDFSADGDRGPTMREAFDTENITVSPPLTAARSGLTGFFIAAPILAPEQNKTAGAAANFSSGCAITEVELELVLDVAFSTAKDLGGTEYHIYDITKGEQRPGYLAVLEVKKESEDVWKYIDAADLSKSKMRRIMDTCSQKTWCSQTTIHVANRTWRLILRGKTYQNGVDQVPRLAMGLITGLSALILTLTLAYIHSKRGEAAKQAKATQTAHQMITDWICHELRNPLHCANMALLFAMDRYEKQSGGNSTVSESSSAGSGSRLEHTTVLEDLRTARANILTLNRVVNDIMDAARFQYSDIEVHMQPHNLQGVIESVVSEFGVVSSCPIAVHVSSTIPERLICDRALLSHTLMLGLHNAVKYTTGANHIMVAARMCGSDAVVVYVADERDTVSLVSTRSPSSNFFSRSHTPRHALRDAENDDEAASARLKSISFGMPLANVIAEKHGGRVGFFQSEKDHISANVFWFSFAAQIPPSEGAPPPPPPLAPAPAKVTPPGLPPTDGSPSPPRFASGKVGLAPLAEAMATDNEVPPLCSSDAQTASSTAETPNRDPVAHVSRRADPTGAASEPDPPSLRDLAQLAVWVVDDEAMNRRLLQRMLQHEGVPRASIVPMDDGEALLNYCAGLKGSCPANTVLLCDIVMRSVNGDVALRQLRKLHGGAFTRLPAIACTGDSNVANHVEYRKAGFDAILTKPFSAEQVRDVILSVQAAYNAGEMSATL